MKYITHNRFKKLAACGEAVNIPYGTEMETAGDFIITTEGKPICYATSEAAKMHFARNDDGQGLERGKLTWAIAYSQRVRTGPNGRQQRFTEEEIELLERKWAHFLRQDVEVILDSLRREADAANLDGNQLPLSYAYGWAISADYEGCIMQTLLDKADYCMYENKRAYYATHDRRAPRP